MCGFVGYVDKNSVSETELLENVRSMSATLRHRGPDDQGEWVAKSEGLALAHRRLSIQDLSALGHQPMLSHSGRYVLAYNGEIYNFADIRDELEASGRAFKGHSDTEVILAAVESWGLQASLNKFVGMFAFALWDTVEHVLILARDRMGEKPLYYGWNNGVFLFGSELKALQKHPKWNAEINRDAITLFLRHNYVPAPHTIYQHIHKLEAGTFLSFRARENSSKIEAYWSLREVFEKGSKACHQGSAEEIADELEGLLLSSIKRQMVADVPVGAFLSGGIDSSTIVALMQSTGTTRVKTFTIGFDDKAFNEAEHARLVSEMLGTEHTELYVTAEQALDVIPGLSRIYDEPFADSSQIPSTLVAKMTREKVTVSLSGDGGDELFCGYKHYFQARNLWYKLQQYPACVRKLGGNALAHIPQGTLDILGGFFLKHFSSRKHGDAGWKLKDLGGLWQKDSLLEIYQHHLSYWNDMNIVLGASEPDYVLNRPENNLTAGSIMQNFQYWDMSLYLPDDILTKVDRAAMASSLETRIPLLDHNIVEFAARIPEAVNLRHASGKWPLRHILNKHLPLEAFDRPKKGFAVPIADWLKGPLHEWASELLEPQALREEGYFDVDKVSTIWKTHLQDRRDYSFQLWGILTFQAWLKQNKLKY